jgi:RNA polymerase sigma-70 factor (ECF subfamily)
MSEPAGSAGTAATPEKPTASPEAPGAEFVQLFTRFQRPLYLYILSLIPIPVEAEEILQETNLVIWSKCRQFQPGTSFFAWSSQIAYYEVLKFRERRRHDRHRFSQEVLDLLAADVAAESEMLELRRNALAGCVNKLKPGDRRLIQLRYGPGRNGLSVAEELGRPVNSVYQSLGRIRRQLLDCVNRRIARETRS